MKLVGGCLLLIVLLAGEYSLDAVKLPPFIKPCSLSDPQFNACALKSARLARDFIVKGDRKYRLLPLDPLIITRLDIDKSGDSVGLNVTMTDIQVTGLKDISIDGYDWNKETQIITHDFATPVTQILCDYVATGKVLVLPISGHGKANLTANNCKSRVTVSYELVTKKDGKRYMKLGEPTSVLKCASGHTQMDNLFNGNKQLSDQMNVFLNENWAVLFDELAPAMADGIGQAITQSLKSMLERIPIDELTTA